MLIKLLEIFATLNSELFLHIFFLRKQAYINALLIPGQRAHETLVMLLIIIMCCLCKFISFSLSQWPVQQKGFGFGLSLLSEMLAQELIHQRLEWLEAQVGGGCCIFSSYIHFSDHI